MQEMGKKNLGRDDFHSKNTDQLRRNNFLSANHFEVSQFMNQTLKNKLIHCAVPTLFDVPNKPKKITLSRPHRKRKGLYKVYTKVSTDYGEPSKKTPTTKLSQLSPKKQFLNVLVN